MKGHGTREQDCAGLCKIERIPGRFQSVAPELHGYTPRCSNRINEIRIRHVRPGDADLFSPDPFSEIRNKVTGIETGQDLTLDIMQAEALLRSVVRWR